MEQMGNPIIRRHGYLAGFLAGLLVFAVGCGPGGDRELEAEAVPQKLVQGELIEPLPKATEIEEPLPEPETQTNAALTQVAASAAPTAERRARRSDQSRGDDDFLNVSFEQLASFNYESDGGNGASVDQTEPTQDDAPIPVEIRELDQRRVALQGFMLPLKIKEGLVTEMLIMRDQSMCCYGTVPRINEWVSVTMDEGVKAIMDQPVTVFGTLHVGAKRDNGYLVGIYAMDGEALAGPFDL